MKNKNERTLIETIFVRLTTIMVFAILGLITLAFVMIPFGCSANKEYLMQSAEAKWKKQGFEIVDYEGFHYGSFGYPFFPYGGAVVYYKLKKIPDNGITYSGGMQRWGFNEIHVYGPSAIDAIKTH